MWEIEKYKHGKRHYGWFLKNKLTEIQVYMARRWHKEIFRSGEITISNARRKGIACWAIDDSTLQLCKIKGVKYVGVKERETGTLYLAPIEEFYNPTHMSVKNYTERGGALQRYLPIGHFRVREGIKIF